MNSYYKSPNPPVMQMVTAVAPNPLRWSIGGLFGIQVGSSSSGSGSSIGSGAELDFRSEVQ